MYSLESMEDYGIEFGFHDEGINHLVEELVLELDEVKANPDKYNDAEDYCKLGTKFVDYFRKDLAIDTFNLAFGRGKKSLDLILEFADALLHTLSIDSSKRLLEDSIAEGYIDGKILSKLGFCYLELKQDESAVDNFEKAAQFETKDASIFTYGADCYDSLGKPAKAVEFLEKAIRLGNTDDSICAILREKYISSSNIEDEINKLEKSLDLEPVDALKSWKLSVFYEASGRIEESTKTLERAVDSKQTNDVLLYDLAVNYFNSNRFQDAINISRYAIDLDQARPDTFVVLAHSLDKIGKTEQSVKVLKKAIKLGKINPDVYLNLGQFYSKSGRAQKAIDIYKEAIYIRKSTYGVFNPLHPSLYKIFEALYDCSSGYECPSFDDLRWEKDDIFARADKLNLVSFPLLIKHNLTDRERFRHLYPFDYSKVFDLSPDDLQQVGNLPLIAEVILSEINHFEINPSHSNNQTNLFELYCPHSYSQIKGIVVDDELKEYHNYVLLSNLAKKGCIFDKRTSQVYLKLMIDKFKRQGKFQQSLKGYKKATHNIQILKGNNLISNTIISKESNKPYDREVELRQQLEDVIGNDAKLPNYVEHFEHRGKFYYVMEMEEGNTLTDLIKSDKVPPGTYDEILKVMAKIHVLMPNSSLKYNFDEKINEKDLEPQFKSALNPIIHLLQHSSHYGVNQDAWTDNWMVSKDDGSLIILDTEERGTIPVAIDLANLLNYVPSSNDFNARLDLVDDYIKYYNQYCESSGKEDSMIVDKDQLKREYCAAVVFKGATNSSNIGSVLYSTYHDQVINTADEMLDYMQKQKMISEEESLNLKDINNLRITPLNN